jgi:hypothetical protein
MIFLENEAEVVSRASRRVAWGMVRKDAPWDVADLQQEAALAALEAIRAGRVKVDRSPVPYLIVAGRREAGLALSRWLCPVSISERMATRAREFKRRRVSRHAAEGEADEGERDAELVAAARTDRSLLRLELEEAQHRLRIRRRRSLERYLARMLPGDRAAAELVLGLDEPPLSAEGAAVRLGTTVRGVNRALDRLRAAAWDDFELRALQAEARDLNLEEDE